ncbi:MAG: glycosyltransferase family 2 protein [Phycisphaerales bacterium]
MTTLANPTAQSPSSVSQQPSAARSGPWKVAIVMPCFNRREDCEKLLGDLARQKLPNIQMWGVVVDNASNEPLSTMRVPDGLQIEFVRSEKNTGGSGGFNLGMSYVLSGQGLTGKFGAPDFVWWLDSDARVSRAALRELVRVMVRCPNVGAVGSALCDTGTGRMWECGGRIDKRHGAFYVAASGDVDRRFLVKAHYVAACSALVRREAIEKTGLFPDNFIYYDDVDWCVQMTHKTGLKVRGAPRSRAFHPPGDRRYALWTRYYNARNCFSHMQVMRLGGIARFNRAMIEVRRAVAQTMMGLDDLAELHMRGLRDAISGKFEQVEPKHVLKPLGFMPHATLPDAVREQLARFGPQATLFVHPLLRSHIAGLEVFRRNLKLLKFSWPADWKRWRKRGLGGHLIRDSLGAAWRGAVSRTADVAIVPTGWPTSWFRGKVLIEITTEGYLVREPKTLPTMTKAFRVFREGFGLALKVAARSPGIRPFPAPSKAPARVESQIEAKP